MTRADLIQAVKVKLEEISPFDEPNSFIIANGDTDFDKVKPVLSYIESSLDEALHNCLNTLPISLLHADIERMTSVTSSNKGEIIMHIDSKGVGLFAIPLQTRLVQYKHPALLRVITNFITTEDSLYTLQQNKYTRGGISKPIAVWSAGIKEKLSPYYNTGVLDLLGGDDDLNEWNANNFGCERIGLIEIFSFPNNYYESTDTSSILLGINTAKTAGSDTSSPALSQIDDFIVLECASMVAGILGNTATLQLCQQDMQNKISSILK